MEAAACGYCEKGSSALTNNQIRYFYHKGHLYYAWFFLKTIIISYFYYYTNIIQTLMHTRPRPVISKPPLIILNSKQGKLAEIPCQWDCCKHLAGFGDHKVHGIFLDSQLQRASRCSSHHLMTLADSSLLSLTMIKCGNREMSNNWVNKVRQFPLTFVWIISLQLSLCDSMTPELFDSDEQWREICYERTFSTAAPKMVRPHRTEATIAYQSASPF